MLAESVEGLWRAVEQIGRPVASLRIPGPVPERVADLIGLPVPEDVALWFAWCNGVAHGDDQVQDDAALIPGYEPLSITDAIAIREWYGGDDPILGASWVPLLGTGGGDFYAAVFGASSDHSYVASIMIGGESRIAYDSIESMVDGFRHLYRIGVFFLNNEGVLDADDERWISYETVGTDG